MELRKYRPNEVDGSLISQNYRKLKSLVKPDGSIIERYPPRPGEGDGCETCHQFAWYSINIEGGACDAAGDFYKDADLVFDKILDLQHPKTRGFCYIGADKERADARSLEMWYCCTSSGLMALVKGYRIYGEDE